MKSSTSIYYSGIREYPRLLHGLKSKLYTVWDKQGGIQSNNIEDSLHAWVSRKKEEVVKGGFL